MQELQLFRVIMVSAVEKKKTRKKTGKTLSKKKLVINVRGKRKKAVARITMAPGKGALRINGRSIDAYSNELFKSIVLEPLLLTDSRAMFDIEVTVESGGVMGQAQAIRTGITKALCDYTGNDALVTIIKDYDRYLFVEDSRRIEPKKYLGRKARARFQKSYR